MPKRKNQLCRRLLSLLLGLVLVAGGVLPVLQPAHAEAGEEPGLKVTTAGTDVHVKLDDFENMDDGSYEIVFKTGDALPGNVGFLARYSGEQAYAGTSLDYTGTKSVLATHYTTGGSRVNSPDTDVTDIWKPNTEYTLTLAVSKENGTGKGNVTLSTDGSEPVTLTYEQNSSGYTGEGGFAIRLNKGTQSGTSITIKSIKQKSTDGTVTKEVDFTNYSGESVPYTARTNKQDTPNPDLAKVELIKGAAEEPQNVLDFVHTAGTDTNAWDQAAGTFKTHGITKWTNVPVYTLVGADPWKTGTVTLEYTDQGVEEGSGKRPSDFGMMLRVNNTGADFLYIGYSGCSLLDQNSEPGTYDTGWFWQYRHGGSGQYSKNLLTGAGIPVPATDGTTKTTLEVTITEEKTITVTINGYTVTQDEMTNWSVGGNGNTAGALTGELSNTNIDKAGSVGIGMITAASPDNAEANVVVNKMVVNGKEYTPPRGLDKSKLAAAIKEAEALTEDDYTPESWAVLEKALEEAKKVNDESDDQAAVNAAEKALTDAIKALVMVSKEVDPGLAEITEPVGHYTQSLTSGGTSSLGGPVVNVNEDYWGMSGKALILTGVGEDPRIPFKDLKQNVANGSYEFTIRTSADPIPSSIGFLARYKDEAHYAGISMDSNAGVVAHYTTSDEVGSSATRHNNTIGSGVVLEPNTTYKVKLSFNNTKIVFALQREGEENFTEYSYTLNDGAYYTGEGGFAIRLRGKYSLIIDDLVQKDANGQTLQTLDFDEGEPKAENFPAYQNKSGTSSENAGVGLFTVPITEKCLDFPTPNKATMLSSSGVFLDNASPSVKDEVLTVRLTRGNHGLVFNAKDKDNYSAIWYNGEKWVAGGKKEGKELDQIELTGIDQKLDKTRTLRLDTIHNTLTISAGAGGKVEDAKTFNLPESVKGLYGKGHVGVYSAASESSKLLVGQIDLRFTAEQVDLEPPADAITIESDAMKVYVGKSFPHVYKYEYDGKAAYGALSEEPSTTMTILSGERSASYETSSKLVTKTNSAAVYEITVDNENLKAVFTVKLEVKGHDLTLTVTDVEQVLGTVRTFRFDEMDLLTMAGYGAEAALADTGFWGNATDYFVSLVGAGSDQDYTGTYTYALLTDQANKTAGAIEGNQEDTRQKYVLKQRISNTAEPYLAISPTAWAWQYFANSPVDTWSETAEMYYDRLPYVTVTLGGDANKDNEVTWQDAGILYRDIMILPYGYEDVKNEWMYISMNMSSQASQPFLRVLDTVKAASYLTDGFGLKVMNKGYQGGGHDDSHGDYDFVGLQQGGADGFNKLIDVGLLYGVKNGVHMNVSEFSLDSTAATLERMNRNGNGNGGMVGAWKWFDKAYSVNKNYDIYTGDLQKRIIEAFGSDGKEGKDGVLPRLAFVYVDVYQSGSHYIAAQLMRYLNEAGLTVGTEYPGDFDQGVTFVHWNTDLHYNSSGHQSEIARFLVQGTADINAPDKALLGSLMPGIGDWRNTNNFSETVTSFYRHNLPTKFLQYFDLQTWTPGQYAKLTGHDHTVVAQVENDINTITLDGNPIAKIDVSSVYDYLAIDGKAPKAAAKAAVFIPWSPVEMDKIYYYNDLGSDTTWTLPKGWEGVSNVYVYKLTVAGRQAAGTVAAAGGKVDLSNLESGTPYILVKAPETQAHRYDASGHALADKLPTLEEHPYGEFTGIQDPGFTLGLEKWTISGNKSAVTIISDTIANVNGKTNAQGDGDPRVSVDGSFAGTISQEITVEPGETYTFSVWVQSASREVTLRVKDGSKVLKEYSVPSTTDYTINFRPTKFWGSQFQRLRLEGVTAPGSKLTLELEIAAGSGAVQLDDFRSWTWTGTVNPNVTSGKYYYYEDFENLDENWGPFVSVVGGQPNMHLSYTLEGQTIKTFAIDGTSFNLHLPDGGDVARSTSTTLKLQPGKTYQVTVDYRNFREILNDAETISFNGEQVAALQGYNVPSNETFFLLVRHANGDMEDDGYVELTPSEFTEIGFSAVPSTKTATLIFTAREGDYLAINKPQTNDSYICIIDNFRIVELDEDHIQHLEQMEHHEAKEATCTEDGNIAYYYCPICKKYYSMDGAEITLEETVVKAHHLKLVHVAAKDPTTEEAGNVEYWYCEICDKYFLDADATQPTTKEAVILPKLDPGVTPPPATRPTVPTPGSVPSATAKPAPGATSGSNDTPKTGDSTPILALLALMAVSAASAAAVLSFTQKKRAKR